ncbi:hypothetical protein ZIOFF_053250 [Zingiber officinale]|uniref:Uncharacterized protein n=1 Tax=Zingiber officinale TaxID=94328 RepID=A0A8J5KCT6_ZINOF|nr:hypothetical protein ZIOFF_053250 [Zingiber officinale]
MFALQLTPMPYANSHGRRLKLLEDIFTSSHHVSILDDELMVILAFDLVISYRLFEEGIDLSTVQAPAISKYDLGAEWDLFKAPELLAEEPTLELDSTADVISVLSPGYATTETIKAADTESIRFKEDHLIDIFYERKDLLEKSETENSISQLSDANAAIAQMDEVVALEEHTEGSMQRSASSGCLRALEWFPNCTLGPDVLDFQGFDFETALGLRRAFSEGDIQEGSCGEPASSTWKVRKGVSDAKKSSMHMN